MVTQEINDRDRKLPIRAWHLRTAQDDGLRELVEENLISYNRPANLRCQRYETIQL